MIWSRNWKSIEETPVLTRGNALTNIEQLYELKRKVSDTQNMRSPPMMESQRKTVSGRACTTDLHHYPALFSAMSMTQP